MGFLEKVKRDLQRGIKEGIEVVREGAGVVRKRAETLTEEAIKQYNIVELRIKVQKEIAELGGRVYDVSSTVKNPLLDKRVRSIINGIKKMEMRIRKLEGNPKGRQDKKLVKRTPELKKKTAQNRQKKAR